MKILKGKIIELNDDEVILKLYAKGKAHFSKTIAGNNLTVGIQSLSYLLSDYPDKEIELWVREINK